MLPKYLSAGTGIRYYDGALSDGIITTDFDAVQALVIDYLDAGASIHTQAAGMYMFGLLSTTPDNADDVSALIGGCVACCDTRLLALVLDHDNIWDLQLLARADIDRFVEDLVSDTCSALPYWFDTTRSRKLVHERLGKEADAIRAQLELVALVRAPKKSCERALAWVGAAWFVSTLPTMLGMWFFYTFIAVSVIVLWRLFLLIKADARLMREEGRLEYMRSKYTADSLAIATIAYGDKIVWTDANDGNNFQGWFHLLSPEDRHTNFNDALTDYLDTIRVTWEI